MSGRSVDGGCNYGFRNTFDVNHNGAAVREEHCRKFFESVDENFFPQRHTFRHASEDVRQFEDNCVHFVSANFFEHSGLFVSDSDVAVMLGKVNVRHNSIEIAEIGA